MTEPASDAITFAVIKSALDTIVDDMAYAVMRTARSPIVRDVLDYSVTLCDRRGAQLGLGQQTGKIQPLDRGHGANRARAPAPVQRTISSAPAAIAAARACLKCSKSPTRSAG